MRLNMYELTWVFVALKEDPPEEFSTDITGFGLGEGGHYPVLASSWLSIVSANHQQT
ncbi:hypothetical protein DPMN_016161 [Dreissena polymorpha]|uniref:Uncharacterized protein n=1 Tax=Dreissena polymorpha TaxID=45954 RepID=A0A9D4S4B6_DREPO|nr:hypothetical protein DPMN_016161 [Dreissena polymorpha]